MASAFIGGTAIGALGLESVKLINQHVFLPLSMAATEEILVASGQDRAEVQAQNETIQREIFDPVFGFIDDIEGSIIHWIEENTGKDINGDGTIGAPDLNVPQVTRTAAQVKNLRMNRDIDDVKMPGSVEPGLPKKKLTADKVPLYNPHVDQTAVLMNNRNIGQQLGALEGNIDKKLADRFREELA